MAKYVIEIEDEPFVPAGYDSDWCDSKYAKLYKAKDVDIVFTKDDLNALTKLSGLGQISEFDSTPYESLEADHDELYEAFIDELEKEAELKSIIQRLANVLNWDEDCEE